MKKKSVVSSETSRAAAVEAARRKLLGGSAKPATPSLDVPIEVPTDPPPPARTSKRAKVEDPPPDWDKIRRNAAREYGPGMSGLLRYQEAQLAKVGSEDYPPMSAYAIECFDRFWERGLTWFLINAGRSSGKSTMLIRVGLLEVLFGDRKVPRGQEWIFPCVSCSSTDARSRLTDAQAVLYDAYGVRADITSPSGQATMHVLDARGQPIALRAHAPTMASLSGQSSAGALVDEEAKYPADTPSVNCQGDEVLRAIRPTFRKPGIRGYRASSAFQPIGSFHTAVQNGDDELQFVARLYRWAAVAREGFARVAAFERGRKREGDAQVIEEHARMLNETSTMIPTWVVNPSQDPVRTRIAEPNLSVWLREYCGVAMVGGAETGATGSVAYAADHAAYTAAMRGFVTGNGPATLDGGYQSRTPEVDLIRGDVVPDITQPGGLSIHDRRHPGYRGPGGRGGPPTL